MPIVEHSIEVPMPQPEAYRIAQGYSVRFDWDPFADKLEMGGGEGYKPVIGGKVFIRSKLGMCMTVEFVQVNPPKVDAVKMVSGPWFLGKFAGSWLFKAIDDKRTLVKFRYSIKGKGFLVCYIIEFMAVIYFSYVVKKRLRSLQNFCDRLNAESLLNSGIKVTSL